MYFFSPSSDTDTTFALPEPADWAASTSKSAPSSLQTTHLLLVDDNRMDIELTLNAFEELGLDYTVHVAQNGQQALDYLFGETPFQDRKRYPLPDLVLLDIKMPGLDGKEVLRQVKIEPSVRRIPVVVLTSSQESRDRADTYDLGANSYLVKPVSYNGFLDMVRLIESYWLFSNERPPVPMVG